MGQGVFRGSWTLIRAAAILAAAMGSIGCGNFFVPPDNSGGGGGGGGTGTGRVYVANATSGPNTTTGSIAGFTIGTGTLTAVPNSSMAVSYQPLAAVVSPNNAFLYVSSGSAIIVYTINSDGSLTAQSNGVVINVVSLDVSPDGKWLFGLDLLSGALDEFQIDSSSGGLSAMTPQPCQISNGATPLPQEVKVSPSGNFVFTALGSAGDCIYSLNTATGATSFATFLSVSSSSSDNGLAVDSTGSTLYIARAGTNGGVAVYTIGGGGVITPIAGSPFAAGNRPFSVVLDKTGKYVYVANRNDNTISGYSIGANKALTALSGSPFTSGQQVNSLGIDPGGTYLLAGANGGSPDLSMYSFDATTAGALVLAKSVATDTDPTNVAAIAVTH
ncbi:MAG TPA: beta-propeller fold lactonase family protein [Edaphobacter sp.]|nr:beta-propeller fold lactonase family protein [Edaphobacter sp.]